MYMATCFIPSGVQVLTCGTDRKIAYWETLDGSLVREIEGSTSATLTAITASHDGRYFLTGSDDSIIKLWDYRNATTVRLGLAHAAPITNCTFAPNGKFIVTVSADSSIMIWMYPFEVSSIKESEPEVSSTICASPIQIKEQNADNAINRNTPDDSSKLTSTQIYFFIVRVKLVFVPI